MDGHWNRIRNGVKRRAQVDRQLRGGVDQCVLRWFGHMERMDEECMTKKVMISDVEGNKCWERPRLGWIYGVSMALGERDMSVEQGRLNVLDRRRWELIVNSVNPPSTVFVRTGVMLRCVHTST